MSQTSEAIYWVLIDTSAAIAVLRHDEAAKQRFAQVDPVISVTVAGELHYGVTRAQRQEHQRAIVASLLANSRVLVLDEETAEQYAVLKRALEVQGTLIPENDMWIAASALQHGLPLATRDAHFNHVAGLTVEQW